MRLGASGRIVVVLWHKRLGWETRLLVRLEGWRVNCTLGNVGERRAVRHLAWIRQLPTMLVKWLGFGMSGDTIHVRGHLLVERLLFLLLRRVERH